jgi:hypothetical protein
VHPAEIIDRNVDRGRGCEVFQLLREAQREPRETAS